MERDQPLVWFVLGGHELASACGFPSLGRAARRGGGGRVKRGKRESGKAGRREGGNGEVGAKDELRMMKRRKKRKGTRQALGFGLWAEKSGE